MGAQSGPTTSLKNQVISEIPHETFLEIVSYLGPVNDNELSVSDTKSDMIAARNRTIQKMALVCRHFYLHLFPLLFENVYNSGSSPSSDEEDVPSRRAAFCKSIVEGDERARTLATYTKSLTISDLYVGKKNPIARESSQTERNLSAACKALAYMSNLQELCLYNTSLTDDFLRSTICLRQLNVLRLGYCNIPKSLDAGLLAAFSALHVARVYTEQDVSYEDAVHYDQFTRHLCLSRTEWLTSEVCVESHTLRGLAASSSPMEYLQRLHLEKIHLDREHPEMLSSVLAVMPALKSLHITEVHYYTRRLDFDAEEVTLYTVYPKLPRLVYVYAPFFAVQKLVPGSNASSVGFSREYLESLTNPGVGYPGNNDFWQDFVVLLHKSKCHMSQLETPASFYWHISFATHFPKLRRLTLNTAHCNWRESSFSWPPFPMMVYFLQSWDTHPRLEELEFILEEHLPTNSPSCISLAEPWTTWLKEKIPTLRVLKFLYAGSDAEQYVDMGGTVSI